MSEIKEYQVPRKFCFVGFSRSEREFALHQTYCNTYEEARENIEKSGISFIDGGFLDDVNGNFMFVLDAHDILKSATDAFLEERRIRLEALRKSRDLFEDKDGAND